MGEERERVSRLYMVVCNVEIESDPSCKQKREREREREMIVRECVCA